MKLKFTVRQLTKRYTEANRLFSILMDLENAYDRVVRTWCGKTLRKRVVGEDI